MKIAVYIEEIRNEATRLADELNSVCVSPNHILLSILKLPGRGRDILEKEGIDTDGLIQVLLKYKDDDELPLAREGEDVIADGLLRAAGDLVARYGEPASAECLIIALTREPGFINHPLIEAIGINWEEIGESLRVRFDTRDPKHGRWEQALISDPGLHKVGVHQSFTPESLVVLEEVFEKKQESGGGDIKLTELLTKLLNADGTGVLKKALAEAGVEMASIEEISGNDEPDIEPFLKDGKVGFSPFLLKGLFEAVNFLSAFPAEKVEFHHLFLGLLKAAQWDHAGLARVLPERKYPFYQYAVMELICQRREMEKFDEDVEICDVCRSLFTSEQIERFRAIPVSIEDDQVILATPGYIGDEIRRQMSLELRKPVEIRLVPAGWYIEQRASII